MAKLKKNYHLLHFPRCQDERAGRQKDKVSDARRYHYDIYFRRLIRQSADFVQPFVSGHTPDITTMNYDAYVRVNE